MVLNYLSIELVAATIVIYNRLLSKLENDVEWCYKNLI
ncbi:Uncharacterised protein [Orientia tsutsugamushi]|nr:Uncharacterised protein [Orientia tsutsugamushi]